MSRYWRYGNIYTPVSSSPILPVDPRQLEGERRMVGGGRCLILWRGNKNFPSQLNITSRLPPLLQVDLSPRA